MNVVELAMGFLLGALASYGVWWFTARGLAPRIDWATKLSRIEGQKSGRPIYRLKLVNSGRRAVVDLTVGARLAIKGLLSGAPGNWTFVDIPVKTSWFAELDPKDNLLVPLRLGDISVSQLQNAPSALRSLLEQPGVELEHVLELGTAAYIQFHALGYDKFSGARRVYRSNQLHGDAVRRGRYRSGNSLGIKTPGAD